MIEDQADQGINSEYSENVELHEGVRNIINENLYRYGKLSFKVRYGNVTPNDCQFSALTQIIRDLRDIYVQLEQDYSLIAALKPENMHLFYASSEVAVLATSEAIRLIVQLPLRTDRRTYTVYEPIPLP